MNFCTLLQFSFSPSNKNSNKTLTIALLFKKNPNFFLTNFEPFYVAKKSTFTSHDYISLCRLCIIVYIVREKTNL